MTSKILNVPIYIHVDNIVFYNVRVFGLNPDGSKKKNFRFDFLLHHYTD